MKQNLYSLTFFYLIMRGFRRTFATVAACQQRTLIPPDTWFCPTPGLACVLMSRPIFLNLPCFRTFEVRTSLGTSLFLGISVRFHMQVHRWCFVHKHPRVLEIRRSDVSCSTWDQRHDRYQHFWSYLDYSCRSEGTVKLTLPFMTNITISTSISQRGKHT